MFISACIARKIHVSKPSTLISTPTTSNPDPIFERVTYWSELGFCSIKHKTEEKECGLVLSRVPFQCQKRWLRLCDCKKPEIVLFLPNCITHSLILKRSNSILSTELDESIKRGETLQSE